VVRVKAVAAAAVSVTIALVFLPLWAGIAAVAVLAPLCLGAAVLGSSVTVDPDAGWLVIRVGIIRQRIRLADVTAVLVSPAKVSIARASGPEISVFAWRKSPLDALLRVPAVAGDIGHSISRASALARAAGDAAAAGTAAADSGAADSGAAGSGAAGSGAPAAPGSGRPARSTFTPARTRARLRNTWICAVGAVEIAVALLIRVHWHNPALTALGVVIALALGVTGLVHLLFGLWMTLTDRALPTTIEV
jgi:hypothetical protein